MTRPIAQEAAYVGAAADARLRIVTQPAEGSCVGTVVWVHAFAEEMNKTRRMSARMARLLAGDGWRVVQKDLLGCGDSAGDFSDASWPAWIQDVSAELRQADPDRPVWLWCVRGGALLASEVLAAHTRANLLLWQPVLSGAQHLQQFLRLHMGGRVLGSAKSALGSNPRQTLREGGKVEIGGYEIAPALAQGLEQASFDVPTGFTGQIVWLELSPDPAPTVSVAAARVAERLKERGVDVFVEAVTGPSFWQTPELEESEALLQRSQFELHRRTAPVATDGVHFDHRTDFASDSSAQERALGFRCGDERMWGVLARPRPPISDAPTGVVIAVGGPQYRVGSHRQFVLLARRLAKHGFSSLRFDYRGMGDSEGACRTFEDVGPDLHAAIDAFQRACPVVREVVVWGLCDAASTAMMHAGSHGAVSGIVAVNPWARSDGSLAAAQVRHYYLSRALQRDFWAKLIRGQLDIRSSTRSLLGRARQAWIHARSIRAGRAGQDSFRSRMAQGMAAFRGRALLLIAGNDLTAKEFLDYTGVAAEWRGVLAAKQISRADVLHSDHTFSSADWRRQAEDATIAWLEDADPAARRSDQRSGALSG